MDASIKEKVDFLKAQLGSLSEKDRPFAASLCKSFDTYQNLTYSQLSWVVKMTDKAMGFDIAPIPPSKEAVVGFEKIISLLTTAKAHLKYPKIKLELNGQVVELSLTTQKSKVPGSVNITDGRPYGRNQWFGRVTPQGEWIIPNQLKEEDRKIVRRVLTMLGENPAETASTYGKVTGNCCFCYKKLTDPHSTAVGYGETCAKHYGLHSNWIMSSSVIDSYKEKLNE